MVAAVALRNENPVKHEPPTPSRDEVLARYRHLREISKRHHSKALDWRRVRTAQADHQHVERAHAPMHEHLVDDHLEEQRRDQSKQLEEERRDQHLAQ